MAQHWHFTYYSFVFREQLVSTFSKKVYSLLHSLQALTANCAMDVFKRTGKRIVNSLSERVFNLDALKEALPRERYGVLFKK